MAMTLEQLRIFVAVAERLHMTQAARALRVTQSAASAAVAALESRHGVLLFNRVGRGLELSQAGRVFLPEAKAVLARAEAASRALDELAGLERGSIAIAASQTVANYWLPERLTAFARAHPALTISFTVANTRQVAQAVLDGLADIGFVEGVVENEALKAAVIGGDRLSLYGAPDHPLVGAKIVGVEDLRAAQWVMREPGSGTRAWFEAELAARGVAPGALKVLLELPSNEAVLAAAARGGSLAAASDLAAAPHIAAGTLKRAPFDLVERQFHALVHRERVPSRAVATLLELQ
jgi:DNA-binding transcriptional LysR family regulator